MALPAVTHTLDAPSPARSVIERALHGRYRVEGLIATGGMASVWRVWEPGLERRVAIKMLAPELAADPEARGRFQREARVLAGLAHAGIMPIFGAGNADGALWYAMPLLEGGTLAQALATRGRLAFDEARVILADLAAALDYAHEHGVVHRDVKPDNVLLDGLGRPVLTDFGVATVATSDHSRSEVSRAFGTPEYMAPEQLLGESDADGRADLYSLGVLGFRMLAGRLPFQSERAELAALQRLARAAPSIVAHRAGVPDDLRLAIDRCLERDPHRRWQSGGELLAALSFRCQPRTRGQGVLGWLAHFLVPSAAFFATRYHQPWW